MRTLAVATFITTLGNGLSFTAAALYATRVVGLSNHQLGFGLGIAALIALAVGFGIGHLADRHGPREVLLFVVAAQGLFTVGYAFVRDYPLFLVAVIGLSIANQGGANVRGALVAHLTTPSTRVRERAFLRAVTNLGFAFGTVGAGVAITADTPRAYVTIILLDALSFFGAMALLFRLPHVPPVAKEDAGSPTQALRDRKFVAAAFLMGMLCIHYQLLEIGIPLWVVQQTQAPRWAIALVFAINCVMCVLFQVRASKGTETPLDSARVVRMSSVLLAGSCVIFWLAHGRSPGVAVVLLVVGGLIQVAGEIRQAAGSWGIGYGLAPDNAQGTYQSVWQSSFTIASFVGPPLLAGFVVTTGLVGWMVMAGIFLAAGILMVPLVESALRDRQSQPVAD